MTASAIEALKGFEDVEGVKESILKGESFIISKQGIDGGFGNSFSASWVLQTIFENKDILKTEKYLVSKQGNDGGVDDKLSDDIDTRIWMTSYVIPAILHKPWNIILNKFTKPIIKDNITIEKKKSIKKYKVVNNETFEVNINPIVNNSKQKVNTVKYTFKHLKDVFKSIFIRF